MELWVELKGFREEIMKKNTFRVAISCLWLLMFACVSCATTPPPEDMAKVEPAVVDDKVVSATDAAEQDAKQTDMAEVPANEENVAAAEPAASARNFSVNVVQVNSNNNARAEAEKDTADTADNEAEIVDTELDQNDQQKEQEMSTPAEPEEVIEEPEARVATLRRVPSTYKVIQYMPDASKSLGTESLLSEISKEVAGKVFYELKEEGEKNFTAKVAVVNAVPLSDLKRETEFGRIMAEYLLTDLADRGLRVTELRMGKEINILPQTGEFIMSRNIGEIANNAPALDYVVISTFTNTRKTLIVQGRLVSLKDGLVKTTWRYGMPLNRELLGLFHTIEAPFTIAVKGVSQ